MGWQPNTHLAPVRQILKIRNYLSTKNKNTCINWTPGHAIIRGNDLADTLAKAAAEEAKKLDAGLNVITHQDIKLASHKSAQSKWQLRWDLSARGRHAYMLMPKVGVKSTKDFPTKRAYTERVLLKTGYAALNSYLHKIGIASSPSCGCGHPAETVSHFLLDCPLHEAARDRLEFEIGKATGEYHPSLETLLGEGPDDHFTQHRNEIQMRLDDFISDSKRFSRADVKSVSAMSSQA